MTKLSPKAEALWAKQLRRIPPTVRGQFSEVVRNYALVQQDTNLLSTYTPNGRVEQLIHEVGHHLEKWIFVLPAANSLGKSAAAIAILGNIIWRSQNRWFSGPRFSQWKAPKSFWYISESSTLEENICGIDLVNQAGDPPEIRKWFPRDRYTFTKAGRKFFSSLTTDTGWTGSFKTYDQRAEKFESKKIGVAIFDEPPPRSIFNAVLARLTLGGIILMPMTPLVNAAWVADELVDKAHEKPHVYVLRGDIEDNCRQHGVRGRLEHAQIVRITSEYDQDEVEARAHGRFAHLRGIVYKTLDPLIHKPEDFPPLEEFDQKRYLIYNIVDPHDARPPMIGWAAVDRWAHGRFFYEYPDRDHFPPFHKMTSWKHTTADVCKAIKEFEQGMGWDPTKIRRYMDPHFGKKPNQVVGRTTAEQFRHEGKKILWPLRYRMNINTALADGHRAVKSLLALTPEKEPRLTFGPHCINIWHDMTHYAVKPTSGYKLDIDGPTERVAEKFKDGADVVRYFAMALKPLKVEGEDEEEAEENWFDQVYGKGASSGKRDWRRVRPG